MTAGKRVVTAGIAVLAILAGSERRPIEGRAASYTLSGTPDGTGIFLVDDNLDVLVNGNVVFTENRLPGSPADHNPIPISADIGDTIEFRVRDTFGQCAKLTTVFLTDSSGRSTVADPGFDLGCGRPDGDQGTVHTYTFVIPDLSATPRAELAAAINPSGNSDPGELTVFKNALYFAATDAANDRELWKLDTTGAPTRVANINPSGSSSPAELTVAGDMLYFKALTPEYGVELWQYDGVAAPSLAADVNLGPTNGDLLYLTSYGNQVVFRANNGQDGDELFTFDTTAGLRLIDIEPVSASCPSAPDCESSPISLMVYQGVLYFSAFQTGSGFQLYSYDGSIRRLTNNIGGATAITGLANRLIFGGFDFGQNRIYSYDISVAPGFATKLSDATVNNSGTLVSNGLEPVVYNNRVYLPANDGINGEELWVSDGTPAGTSLAADVNPGSGSSRPKWLHVFNGELYFQATEPVAGSEPRAFNGAPPPRLVKDLIPGPSGGALEGPAVLGPYLVFQAFGSPGRRIWFTAGSESLTDVINTPTGAALFPEDESFVLFNGALYVNANQQGNGTQLWRITLGAAAATITTLSSSLNPSIGGDQVTFTATVTGESGIPEGTVTFFDDITPLGSVTLAGGIASLDISTLAAGSHTITARYGGDATNAVSVSGPLVQTVDPPPTTPTTTTLASSPNPSTFGQSVTLTATVTGGTPTGFVTFFDGVTSLATVGIAGNTAVYATSSLSGGAHDLTARYNGDGDYAPSTSNVVNHVVSRASTSVGLFSSKNPSKTGDSVTFIATLNADATDTITFLDNGTPLGSAAIAGGQASLTVSSLAIGAHLIVARYSGDAKYAPADSATLTQTVNPLNSAPQIGLIGDRTLPWGQFLDILVGASDADSDPIAFSLAAPPAGASITTGGRFTWTPSSAQVGTFVITVEASDGTLVGSRSFTATVQSHATTIGISPPFEAAPGPVELRAELRDLTDGTPLAGQPVTFTVGTQSITAVTDAAGLARPVLQLAQDGGTVGYTASYAGATAYLASAQTTTFRVNLPLVIAPVPPQQIAWGRTLTVPVQITNPDGDPLNLALLNPPAGLQLNGTVVSWTPTVAQIGVATVTVRITDAISVTNVTFPVTVLPHGTQVIDLEPAGGTDRVFPRATLIDTELATPLAGQTLTFVIGGQQTAAASDAFGVARGSLVVNQPSGPVVFEASFAGAPGYAPSTASRSFQSLGPPTTPDSDGDGLSDDWESNGVDVDGNGSIDLDLPGMGADPLRKDIFIEADWMIRPPTCIGAACFDERSFQPQAAALQIVIDAFAAAPVPNPDGSTGITLHIDAGPGSVMDPTTGATWGARSRATAVPYAAILGKTGGAFGYDWSDFDAIKQLAFEPARRGAFRYGLYADRLPFANVFGLARDIGSTDFIVVAGAPEFGAGGMTTKTEAHVVLHEIGHLLGLGHGGGDNINFKPNYFSIMNYAHASGVPPDLREDYSRVAEPPIDEAVVGDVNGDSRLSVLSGFDDWANLAFMAGGIGGLLALPVPTQTPILDPDGLGIGTVGRDGDGATIFRGPWLLVRNSGVRALSVDVANVSAADAQYVVSLDGVWLAASVSASVEVPAGQVSRVRFSVDTTALAAGVHLLNITLRRADGTVVHQRQERILVLDLTDPASATLARQTADALAQLPPNSGFDSGVVAEIVDMINDAVGAWQAVVAVGGPQAFSTTYIVAEPQITGGLIKVIRAQSAAGTPEFLLELLSTGNLAAGRVRMRTPSGSIFEALVAGRWNAATRTFDGKWAMSRQTGSISVQLKSSP